MNRMGARVRKIIAKLSVKQIRFLVNGIEGTFSTSGYNFTNIIDCHMHFLNRFITLSYLNTNAPIIITFTSINEWE